MAFGKTGTRGVGDHCVGIRRWRDRVHGPLCVADYPRPLVAECVPGRVTCADRLTLRAVHTVAAPA